MSEADEEPMEKPGDEWGMKTTEPGERGEMSKKYSTGELVKIIKNGMLFVEGSKALITKLRAADEVEKKYNELLYEVARKYPNETRHDTARRYIREAERVSNNTAQDSKAITEYEEK